MKQKNKDNNAEIKRRITIHKQVIDEVSYGSEDE